MTFFVLALAMIAVTLLALYRRHRDEYIEIDDADIWAVTPPPPPRRRAA